jgi:hypothetical protein
MKKQITLIAFLTALAFGANAAVLTVSNHPQGGAQYGSLQSAYNAANAGDTLLLEATDLVYFLEGGYSYWDKSLVVIGGGLNAEKDISKQTIINHSYQSEFRMRSAGNGSKFYGIVFAPGGYLGFWDNVNNYTFENCQFEKHFANHNYHCNSIVFRNCIFNEDNAHNYNFPGSATASTVFSNCIFDGYIHGNNNPNLTVLFDHCIFNRPDAPINTLRYAIISNCIFYNGLGVSDGSTSDCNFMNNVARLSSDLPPAGNLGSGNLTLTDPLFVDAAIDSYYSPDSDYDLQAGSPGIGVGSDGTDIGVHGGTTNFSETGEVLIAPVMRTMIIENTSVAPNGTLSVQVVAGKPIDD